MAKVRHMPAAFANQANGQATPTNSSPNGGSTSASSNGVHKPSPAPPPAPHQGQFFKIPKISNASPTQTPNGSNGNSALSFEDVLGSGDTAVKSPKHKSHRSSDSSGSSGRSPKKEERSSSLVSSSSPSTSTSAVSRSDKDTKSSSQNQQQSPSVEALTVSSRLGGDRDASADSRDRHRADSGREDGHRNGHRRGEERSRDRGDRDKGVRDSGDRDRDRDRDRHRDREPQRDKNREQRERDRGDHHHRERDRDRDRDPDRDRSRDRSERKENREKLHKSGAGGGGGGDREKDNHPREPGSREIRERDRERRRDKEMMTLTTGTAAAMSPSATTPISSSGGANSFTGDSNGRSASRENGNLLAREQLNGTVELSDDELPENAETRGGAEDKAEQVAREQAARAEELLAMLQREQQRRKDKEERRERRREEERQKEAAKEREAKEKAKQEAKAAAVASAAPMPISDVKVESVKEKHSESASSTIRPAKVPKLEVAVSRTCTPSPVPVLPPIIPGLTITPLTPTPPPAAQPSSSTSSPDLQKLLKTLGTNIIPIAEKSKSSTSGLTIQPVPAAVAPPPPTPVALNCSSQSSAKPTLPVLPVPALPAKVQSAADASMFFKKLPSPMEINNAQLKQANGAGFFKLPPGTTKYIAENKQRRLAPPPTSPAGAAPAPPLPPQPAAAAPPPPPLPAPAKIPALPGLAGVGNVDTALAMAAMLQSAILHKMKEPLNGLTLNDLIKSGLASQSTASEKALQHKQQQALQQQQQKQKKQQALQQQQQQQVHQVQQLLQQQAQQLLQQQVAQQQQQQHFQQQQQQKQQQKLKQQQQIAEAKKAEETKIFQELKRKMEQAAILEIKKQCLQPLIPRVTPTSTTAPTATNVIPSPVMPMSVMDAMDTTTPDWTPLDLMVLTERMKRAIPGPDNIQFGKMEGRLDWSQIAFAKYSSVDCRSKWAEVSQKVRQFRTLSELLSDTQELIKTSTPGILAPPANTTREREPRKSAKHPELPKKPLTPYMRQLWNLRSGRRRGSTPATAVAIPAAAAAPAVDTGAAQNVITINLPLTAAPETYLVDKLKVVKERYPDLSHTEASKQITDKWHTLSEGKKQQLKTQFDLDMVDYQKKLEKFFRNHPEANPTKSGSLAAAMAAVAVEAAPTASSRPKTPTKSESPKVDEPAKTLCPIDLKTLEERIRQHVDAALEKFATSSTPPSEKPPNNGYALFAKICQIDLEPSNLTFKEMMSEMVKRWQLLTEDHRKQLSDSAKAIKTAHDDKFGHLNHSKVHLDKNGKVVVSAMPVESKKPKKTIQTIPIPMEKPLKAVEKGDPASDEITPLELYKKEKFGRLKEDYPDKLDHELYRVLTKQYMDLGHEDRLVWRERAKMINEERRVKENPKGKEKDTKEKMKKSQRVPKRKPLPGEPKRPPMSGYSVFTNEVMQRLRDTNQPKVLISVVAKQWTALPADSKSEYKMKAAELNRAYKEEVANFLKTLSPEQVVDYKAHLEATSKRRGRRDQDRAERRGLSEDSEDVEDEVVLSRDADEESQSESDVELRHSSAADCTSSEDEAEEQRALASAAVASPSTTAGGGGGGSGEKESTRKRRPATDESSSDEETPAVSTSAPPRAAPMPSMPSLETVEGLAKETSIEVKDSSSSSDDDASSEGDASEDDDEDDDSSDDSSDDDDDDEDEAEGGEVDAGAEEAISADKADDDNNDNNNNNSNNNSNNDNIHDDGNDNDDDKKSDDNRIEQNNNNDNDNNNSEKNNNDDTAVGGDNDNKEEDEDDDDDDDSDSDDSSDDDDESSSNDSN